jgi:hypothetical protein
MGQQQILLVILVTIVIGTATLLAVNVLNQRSDQANVDAVRQDLAAAASYVQAIWERPNLMGGANRNFNNLSEEIILQYLNIPATEFQPGDEIANNRNGKYWVEIVNERELTIYGEPNSGRDIISIRVFRSPDTGQWDFAFSDIESESE